MSVGKESTTYPVPASLRTFFRFFTFLSPRLGSFLALNIFFRPIPFSIPEREKPVRKNASSSTEILHSNQKKFSLFKIGSDGSKKILFVHGWSGRGSQFYALIDDLSSKGFQCFFFDAPGHGENPDSFADMPTFIETIKQLDQEMGSFEAIIGHSLGGMAALNAMNQGVYIKGIVTICSPSSIDGVIFDFAHLIGGGTKLIEPLISRIEKKYKRSVIEYSPNAFMSSHKLKGLIIQDRQDTDVPMRHAIELKNEWKTAQSFFTENLGHRKVLSNPEVLKQVYGFLMSLD